ncbi:MAG: gliding motility-associated C-terminal domain-containing protein [Flavobacteriales bacterium]
MRRIPVLFFLLVATTAGNAQTISDCEGAIVLCGDLYTEDQASLNTGDTYEWTGGCNNGLEQSSVWYTFTVQSDGNLGFTLTPNNLDDDYDWGLFNISDGGCAGITLQDGSSPEVSCNSWGALNPPNGATGISTAQGGISNSGGPGDLNGPPFNSDLPVLDGEVYALVVMNWSNSFDGYTIDFAESTASLYDDIPPVLIQALTDCANGVFTLTFSEPIVLESVQNFDFTITGPGGTFGITSAVAQEPGGQLDDVIIVTLDQQIVVPGIYTIVITDENGFVEDPCGNLATESIEIELFAPMTFESEVTTACNGEGGSVEITSITGGEEPYSFYFDGELLDALEVNNLDNGSYDVVVTDVNGCTLNGDIVIPNHNIEVSIPSQDSLSCVNPVTTIVGVAVNPQQSVSYSWTILNGEGNIVSGSSTDSPVVSQPGTYSLVVTETESGCTASDAVTIAAGEVYGVDLDFLIFPNVVTPNADGKNESWAPYLTTNPELDLSTIFDEYELKIFNRWGNLIFETSGGSIEWQVRDVSEGSYFYTLKYATSCGESISESREGIITVLK